MLTLKYDEMRSYPAVAELVGCDQRTVKAWLERGESSAGAASPPTSS